MSLVLEGQVVHSDWQQGCLWKWGFWSQKRTFHRSQPWIFRGKQAISFKDCGCFKETVIEQNRQRTVTTTSMYSLSFRYTEQRKRGIPSLPTIHSAPWVLIPPKRTYSHISPLQSMPEEASKIRNAVDSSTDSTEFPWLGFFLESREVLFSVCICGCNLTVPVCW